MDPRIDRLAELMVNYSNAVKPGDQVSLTGPVAAQPLLAAIYARCVEAGAFPTYDLEGPSFQEILLKKGNRKQLEFLPPWRVQQAETIDCLFKVQGETNTRALSGVDPKKQQLRLKGLKPLRDVFHRRMDEGSLRWCLTLFPTEAHAQDADMSLADFENFVYTACKVDVPDPAAAWRKVQRQQQKMVEFLNGTRKIRIIAPGTDITLSVKGRSWINCCGTENLPDGEVFTGPVEDSANGTIQFSFPACLNGREVEGVCLSFKDGKVVEAHARKNEEYLFKMLDIDSGARFLGEFSFATNRGIQRFTRNILFDEKIGGTVHLALGASYAESGGRNKSVLHWDMICDLRQDGRVLVDGKLFFKEGEFTLSF